MSFMPPSIPSGPGGVGDFMPGGAPGGAGGPGGPPGTLPFVDPSTLPKDSLASATVGVASMCLVLGILAVTGRLGTRYFIVKKLGIDDAMAALSLVFLIATCIAMILNVETGMGTHIWLLKGLPQSVTYFMRDFWYGLVFYNICLLFIKMTFLFQYYRVVAQIRNLRIAYLIAMFLIGAWTLGMILVIIFFCSPINRFWDRSVPGKCIEDQSNLDMNAIGNIVTDFLVLVLPLPVLWRLKLPRPQKLALLGIFCLGFLTCIISIIRRIELRLGSDLTFDAMRIASWSTAEITSGIICASLPPMRPLASRFMPSLTSAIAKVTGVGASTPASRGDGKRGSTAWPSSSRKSRGFNSSNMSSFTPLGDSSQTVDEMDMRIYKRTEIARSDETRDAEEGRLVGGDGDGHGDDLNATSPGSVVTRIRGMQRKPMTISRPLPVKTSGPGLKAER